MKKPEIIYEDQSLCICYKPSGLPVQTKNIRQQDLERMLLAYLPNIYVAHRLDQPVEGVMAFAKTKSAAASLSRQFQESMAHKTYLAVVEGHFEQEKATLTDYLIRDARANFSHVVSREAAGAKKAVLSYIVLENQENSQLLKINLMTGRHHQIRVQLSNANHPIKGDRKYNPICQQADAYTQKDILHKKAASADESKRQSFALCACALELIHPVTKEKMRFETMPKGEFFQDFQIIKAEHF